MENKNLVKFWLAVAIVILFWVVVFAMASMYLEKFRIHHTFEAWHMAIQYTGIGTTFILACLFRNKIISGFFWLLCGAFHVLLPISYLIQEHATVNVAHRISFEFIASNWAAIRVFVEAWMVVAVFAGALSVILILVWSLRTMTFTMGNKSAITSAVLLIAGLWLHAFFVRPDGIRHLHWEPVLTLFGYVGEYWDIEAKEQLAQQEIEALDGYKTSQTSKRENIVVFMADSVNASHLDLFGYHRETIPFLSNLSTHFKNVEGAVARSTCAESVCGIISTLASRRYQDMPRYRQKFLSLSEILKRHGYETNMVLVSDHRKYLHGEFGKFTENQADHIHDYTTSQIPLNSDRLAIEGLEKLPDFDGTPRFIFVFFFSPHVAAEKEKEFEVFGPYLDRYPKVDENVGFSDEQRRQIADNYDNKLLQLNHYLEKSLGILKEKNYTDKAHLLFLSDHGEEVGDHPFLAHGKLTESGLRIPLVWASNSTIPSFGDLIPEQMDIAPSLLDALDMPIPEIWQGQSLFSKPKGTLIYHENGIIRFTKGQKCTSVYGGLVGYEEAKYVKCSWPGSVRHEFYDVKNDRHEKNNLWESLAETSKTSVKELHDQKFGK